jgi:exopolysaccharide biosynthesis polyprenyl glycosylphosphotransferase
VEQTNHPVSQGKGVYVAVSESYVPNLYADALADTCEQRQVISRDLFRRTMIFSELTADFLTCVAATIVAYLLQLYFGAQIRCSMKEVAAVGIMHGIFAVLLLQRKSVSDGDASLLRIRETERAIRTSIQSLLLLLLMTFILRLNFPRTAILVALGLTPILLIAQKQIFASILQFLHAKGYGIDRVVVYGAGETGKRIVSTLLYSPRLGLRPVAVIGDSSVPDGNCMFELGYRRCHSVPVQNGPVTPELLKSFRCSLLIVAMPPTSSEGLNEVIHVAKQAGAPIAFISGLVSQERNWVGSIDVDGLQLASIAEPIASWHYVFAKRVVDICAGSLLLVVFSPLLFLIALLIRLGSPGPALFVQKRAGKNGELFDMYKFRSMHTSAPRYDVSPTQSSDPRITRFGRFLRRTSLDELPKLINVFLGNMSLVGPRPEMPFIVDRYGDQHRRRLQVIPGITGLWQLSADRAFPIHENIEYDLYYIRNRTFFMDVAILLHTLLFAIGGGI